MVSPFAFLLQDQLSQYGAFIAIACLIGLALLVVMQFAHAQELRNVAEEADELPEHIHELEERLEAQGAMARRLHQELLEVRSQAQQAAATPAPVATTAATTAIAKTIASPLEQKTAIADAIQAAQSIDPPAINQIPVAGSKAILDMPTEAHSLEELEEAARKEAARKEAEAYKPMAKPLEIAANTQVIKPEQPLPTEPLRETSPVNEADQTMVERPARDRMQPRREHAASSRHHRPITRRHGDIQRPSQRTPASALRGNGTSDNQRSRSKSDQSKRGSSGGGRRLTYTIVGGLIVAAIAGLGVWGLSGGSEPKTVKKSVSTTSDNKASKSRTAGSNGAAPAIPRADVKIAVFNGTTVNGTASTVSNRLQQAGFAPGATGNYPDQSQMNTSVLYSNGMQRSAEEVARLLQVSDVRPMDPENQALAGEDAKVLVVVGSDHSQQQ